MSILFEIEGDIASILKSEGVELAAIKRIITAICKAFQRRFAGERIYIKVDQKDKNDFRNPHIIEDSKSYDMKHLRWKYGLSEGAIRRILKASK